MARDSWHAGPMSLRVPFAGAEGKRVSPAS